MLKIQRQSPVSFAAEAIRTEEREHWNIVLEYEKEGDGPWLADLSHRPRWDVQDGNMANLSVFGNKVPEKPNSCIYCRGTLINRMNATQASVWHMDGEPQKPAEKAYTDTADAGVFLALAGKYTFAIAEKLTDLDFLHPQQKTPFLMQGPFSHVPCQIVVADRGETGKSPFPAEKSGLILLLCSRGYARDMVHAILAAGAEFGIRPAGEDKILHELRRIFSG
ncbi:MAG: sarcosine oxidase subunit gamma SoxG [Desulfococcaceae bacterium]|jgi:hypothetical protein|nr:sarcosine oxidase subunit gamma SoxG [Desulfococcaceae bacterium]